MIADAYGLNDHLWFFFAGFGPMTVKARDAVLESERTDEHEDAAIAGTMAFLPWPAG